MTILVTGGGGYIGSHMVLALLDAGEDVLVIDNLSTGFRWAVPGGAGFVAGDIGDCALIKRLVECNQVDAVIHFAGSLLVAESVANPLAYYLNNTCKSRSLIETVIDAGVRNFIFSSSASVYGVPQSSPVAEDSRLEPISPYGSSKLMTEIILREAGRAHDLRFVALRYFNVAGADPQGGSGESTRVAPHLIKVAAQAALGRRSSLEIFGTDYPTADGTCVRDYIHVSDLADAHLSALKYLREGGESETLNCGYGRGYSVLEVVESVKRVSKSDFPTRVSPPRPGDPAELIADVERITRLFSWRPRYADLDIIITHALKWEEHLAEVAAEGLLG